MGIRSENERHVFDCDRCDATLTIDTAVRLDATAEARAFDWTCVNLRPDIWYCASCAERMGAD